MTFQTNKWAWERMKTRNNRRQTMSLTFKRWMEDKKLSYRRLCNLGIKKKRINDGNKIGCNCCPCFTVQGKNLSYLNNVKGAMSRDFMLQVFFMNIFPQTPNIRVISNLFENSRRHSEVKVHRWCPPLVSLTRTISDCLHLEVNLMEKIYLYVNR